MSDLDHQIILGQLRAYWKCRHLMASSHPLVADQKSSCQPEFDGYGCWAETPAETNTSIPCPGFLSPPEPSQQVTRHCSNFGRWVDIMERSDYRICLSETHQVDAEIGLTRAILNDFSSMATSPYEDTSTAPIFEDCLVNVLSKPSTLKDAFCVRTFDGWGCWNDTPAGYTAQIPCPSFIPGFSPERFAHKICNLDGSWYTHPDTNRTWSNYTTCVDEEDLQFRQKINTLYIVGYSVSAITLIISLLIFFHFKSLQCMRITVHKNLFLSFIINNIMWIVWYTQVVHHPQVLLNNSASCQFLHLLLQYFLMCNYMWMFCEGLHLHLLMVVAFVQDMNVIRWFYFIGWGIPGIFLVLYAIARGCSEEGTLYCWIEESSYLWIITGPICLSMMINLLFLVNIVRVLVTKMQALNSRETHQTRKAVRATLILLPLLGLHYFLTPFRPEVRSTAEVIYEVVSAVATSFQGFSVGLLFCFLNGEVMSQMRKFLTRRRLLMGGDRRVSSYATASRIVT